MLIVKNLVIIRGPMGVGKTAVSRNLQELLPNAVLLDGDWCWDAKPFVVNDETKVMVLDNIVHLLANFLRCTAYQNIIFCWVLQDRGALLNITNALSLLKWVSFRVFEYTLICDPDTLRRRLEPDIASGVRKSTDLERSLEYVLKYQDARGAIDVSDLNAEQTAAIIADAIQ